MSKQYNWNIEGKNFLCKNAAFTLKEKQYVGKRMANRGIWYDHDNKTAYLSSNSMADIVASSEFRAWEHSCRPKQMKNGYKVIVLPSGKAVETALETNTPVCSVEFEYTGNLTEVDTVNNKRWPSQNR